MYVMRRWFFIAAAAIFFGPAVKSQPPAAPGAAEKWYVDRSLTLTPMGAPSPIFKYRLFPLASELKDGNAVPIYLRLNHEQNDAARKRWYETPRVWNEAPIDKIPLPEARAFLSQYAHFYRQFDLGALRKSAEWNFTLDQGSVVDLLIPDVQWMRSYAPMLVLRAKVQILDGDFAAAARSLETGFAFSRHVADAPLLISGLVGIAIAGQFADGILDFVERPGAPNLYWALAAIPRPLIGLRKAMEFEQRFFEMEFPDIRDIDRPRSPAEWDALLKRLRLKMNQIQSALMNGQTPPPTPPTPAGTGPEDPASQSPDLPAAKRYLVERRGMTPAAVDAMPPAQVLLLTIVGVNDDIRDRQFTAVYVPSSASAKVLAANDERLKLEPNTEATRLARLWLPKIVNVQLAESRLERKLAALQLIEALRMHAAANGSQLPDSLEQVKVVPVPPDPGTGRPFEYRKEGDKAVLSSRIPGEPLDKYGLRYTITIRGK